MNWRKLSPYAIACEPYTISKALVNGEPRYTLWEGERMVGIFRTPEEAKERAEVMVEKEVESV
ncbi:hypothetical protein SAMN05216404_106177 [Nitrosospira multiformis]|uniref:Uncharacterized protein n=1 Tax=Nitrosospira multiformis TaxID=1231 RepID=A0A1H8ISZ8_9PROT|nr:hypothetical protein [Nitrosospira multiformis]SEN71763.1 hypothetical protein SAMN05216404_106177 [Nitrosospira multiformis]